MKRQPINWAHVWKLAACRWRRKARLYAKQHLEVFEMNDQLRREIKRQSSTIAKLCTEVDGLVNQINEKHL